MYLDQDVFDAIGESPIVCVFGDKNFPSKKGAKPITERRDTISKIKNLFFQINPRKIYLTPDKGINSTVILICIMMKIPYVIVNPYEGYTSKFSDREKVNLSMDIEGSTSVITVGKPPKSLKEERSLESEVIEFMVDCADVTLSFFGKANHPEVRKLRKKVLKFDKSAIFVNYAVH